MHTGSSPFVIRLNVAWLQINLNLYKISPEIQSYVS